MPWKKYLSPKGKEYYHNSDTNETTWKKPSDFVEAPKKTSSSNMYVKVTNAKGKTYSTTKKPMRLAGLYQRVAKLLQGVKAP